jgi:hypothetical protein
MQALFTTDYRSHRLDVPAHHPGTLKWVLMHTNFVRWLEDNTAAPLWVSGNPGMGKTVLALLLVETFENRTAPQPGDMTIYFFCSDQDEDRKTAISILKAIIHQCLQLQPSFISKYVIPEYFKLGDKLYLSFATLWDLFIKVTTDPALGRVFCVVDALDECEEVSRNQFLRQIGNPFARLDAPKNLKLVITSRPYDSIRVLLFSSTVIRFKTEQEEDSINKDIAAYVQDEVKNLARFRGYAESLKETVLATLLSGADGMFLWVSLMLTILKRMPRNKVLSKLQHLPRGIDGLYLRIVQEIPEDI